MSVKKFKTFVNSRNNELLKLEADRRRTIAQAEHLSQEIESKKFDYIHHLRKTAPQNIIIPKEIASVLTSRGLKMHSLSLVEEGPDMGLENILSAVRILKEADAAGEKVILHCTCGNNRSRTIAEAFCYAKTGELFADE